MVSVIGLGFVGSALYKSFNIKDVQPLHGYDKFKNGGIGCFDECLKTPIMFICLPTPYNDDTKSYGKEAIYESMEKLADHDYKGLIVLKSTVEPGTTEELSKKYSNLSIAHNPEFLSAATAFEDFHNQKHVVLGKGINCSDEIINTLHVFYSENYPGVEISICSSNESESMKSFVNCFYAVKIQFFNELFLLCQSSGCDYNTVKELMLKNKWINPMHTSVPGSDGKLSYGGGCFPKDTNALLQHMKRAGTPHGILESCIKERNVMRSELPPKEHNHTNGGDSETHALQFKTEGGEEDGYNNNKEVPSKLKNENNGMIRIENGLSTNGILANETIYLMR